GNGSYANSPAFMPETLGTYRWRASYSGDANNAGVDTVCNEVNESSLVVVATPSVTTRATQTATLGQPVSDQATISNGGAATGTPPFKTYVPDDANCSTPPAYTSSPVTVSGNHNYVNSPTFAPAVTGTYRWTVSYSGDGNNNAVATSCNDP